jgi:6-phosphogluconolactonase
VICLGGYSTPGVIAVARETDDGLAVESTVECPGNPTYLAASADSRFVYACHELDEGRLSAYALDGVTLTPLGDVPSGGGSPCHLSVHRRHVLTAHWGTGELTVHPISADGSLGAVSQVLPTGKASAHWIHADPGGRWVLAVHLGLGTVTTYAFTDGRLREHHVATQPHGAGPRHLAFHPHDDRVFVVNELHSTVTAGTFSAGEVTLGRTVSTLPAGVETTNHPSAILVTPDGRHVLVANRLHDSIAVFSPDLELLGTYPSGHFPRDMVLSPDGRRLYVANERAGEVVQFRFDDGVPTPFGTPLAMAGPSRVLPV